jgi:hypothetical protein
MIEPTSFPPVVKKIELIAQQHAVMSAASSPMIAFGLPEWI